MNCGTVAVAHSIAEMQSTQTSISQYKQCITGITLDTFHSQCMTLHLTPRDQTAGMDLLTAVFL